jgi:flagellin-like protein
MIRQMNDHRKAITPILATLLLVVIAVAAIAVTYAWIMMFMNNATNQAGINLQKDAVNWQAGPPEKILVYVRNSGVSDATIDAVYVGTSNTNLVLQTSVTYDPPSKVVSKEGGTTVTIIFEYNWTSQTTYYFRIVPKIGEPLPFQEQAP